MTDQPPVPASPHRDEEVDRIALDVLRRRQRGEHVDVQEVLDNHAHLLPELQERMQGMEQVARAREQVGTDNDGLTTQAPVVLPTGGGLPVRCPACRELQHVTDESLNGALNCPACGESICLVEPSGWQPGTLVMKRFRVIDHLGSGGFGAVWRVYDNALGREVAIKVPHPWRLANGGMDWVLREARAAAQLAHPNIVAVFEVVRDGNEVVLVNEFVRGRPLSEILAEGPLDDRRAAELTATMARAVHEAHQQGVIHRDLKPSNVLMDENGEPHVSDFGLARREAGDVTMTVDGQILGTPAYMSPEQARGEAHRTDRRADVYSLGVMLFEMLTGEVPFRGEPNRLLHQVVHDEAPRPSRLRERIAGDLETICLRCLEKDADRRFATAGELADDLERFLRSEPIVSRPVTSFGKLARWYRRNPRVALLTITASALSLLLLISIIVANVRLMRETARSRQARVMADQRVDVAGRAIREMLDDVASKRLLNSPHVLPIRARLLSRATKFYLASQDLNQSQVCSDLATMYFRRAWIARLAGDKEEARSLLQQSIAWLERARRRDPHHRTIALELASAFLSRARVERQLSEFEEVERSLEQAGALLEVYGPPAHTTRDGRELQARHLQLHAALLAHRGDVSGAENALRESTRIWEDLVEESPDSETRKQWAEARHELGEIYRRQGNYPASEREMVAAADMMESLVRDDGLYYYSGTLAYLSASLGDFNYYKGDPDASFRYYAEAHEHFDRLSTLFPHVVWYWQQLAAVEGSWGWSHYSVADHPEAIRRLRESVRLQEWIHEQFQVTEEMQNDLGNTLNNLAAVLADDGQMDAASSAMRRAAEMRRRLAESDPDRVDYHSSLAATLNNLGVFARREGRFEEARRQFLDAIGAQRIAWQSNPHNPGYREFLAIHYMNLGAASFELKRDAECQEALRTGLEFSEALVRDFPGVERHQMQRATTANMLAWVMLVLHDDRLPQVEEAREYAELAVRTRNDHAGFWNTLALCLYRRGDWAAARAAQERSFELGAAAVDDWLVMSLIHCGEENWEAAAQAYAQAEALQPSAEPSAVRSSEIFRAEYARLLEERNETDDLPGRDGS